MFILYNGDFFYIKRTLTECYFQGELYGMHSQKFMDKWWINKMSAIISE